MTTVMAVEPASSEFSINSFSAEAGLCTTSPAAMRFTTTSSSFRMGGGACAAFAARFAIGSLSLLAVVAMGPLWGEDKAIGVLASSRAVACTHVMMDEDILAQSHKLWAYGQLQSQSSARCPAAGTMFKPLSYAVSSCRRHVQPYKWARNPGSRLVAHPVRGWTVEPALPCLGTGRLISTCVARRCGVSPSKCDETDDHWFVRSLSKTFATHPGVSAAYVLGLDLVNAGLMYFVIKAVGMSWLCSHAPLLSRMLQCGVSTCVLVRSHGPPMLTLDL